MECQQWSSEQMKQIFPLGAPETFQPFHPERCLYKIVETPHECLSSNAVVPATSTMGLESPLTTATMEVPVTDLVTVTEPEGVEERKTRKKKRTIKKKSMGCC